MAVAHILQALSINHIASHRILPTLFIDFHQPLHALGQAAFRTVAYSYLTTGRFRDLGMIIVLP